MWAILEMDVFVHKPFQMPLIENDHMVEQIPAAGAYPAFRNAFCHGLRKLVGFGPIPKLFTVSVTSLNCGPAIKDQVAGAES